MAERKSNRAVEIIIDEKEPQVVQAQTKENFTALMAAYSRRNPAKYEAKKEALEKKLASL